MISFADIVILSSNNYDDIFIIFQNLVLKGISIIGILIFGQCLPTTNMYFITLT